MSHLHGAEVNLRIISLAARFSFLLAIAAMGIITGFLLASRGNAGFFALALLIASVAVAAAFGSRS